jgi:hypothetical protein
MKLPTGIHPGLGMKEYHSWKLDRAKLIEGPISASMLKRFAPNPYEWLHTPEMAQTAAMRTGSLFDAALTDEAAFEESVVCSPFADFRSKAARDWRDEQAEAGRLVTTQDMIDKALLAAEKCREHEIAGSILEGAQFQIGVVGEIGGIPAKCLPDIVPAKDGEWGETLADYKTTANGLDDESIRRTIGQFKYHWQAAFYRSLWNQVATDRLCEEFLFIFQSTSTLEVRVVKLHADALALGTRAVREAIKEYARCAHNGIGSKYARRCDELDLLPFHAMNEDEQLAAQEGFPS